MAKLKTSPSSVVSKTSRTNGISTNGVGKESGLGLNWLKKWRKKVNDPANGLTRQEIETEIRKYLEGYLAGTNAFRLPKQPVYRLVSFKMIDVPGRRPGFRFEAYTFPPTVKGKHEHSKVKTGKTGPKTGGGHLIPAPPPTPPPQDEL